MEAIHSAPPNWVLRTASCPAKLAGLIAVRSTRAQHLGVALRDWSYA